MGLCTIFLIFGLIVNFCLVICSHRYTHIIRNYMFIFSSKTQNTRTKYKICYSIRKSADTDDGNSPLYSFECIFLSTIPQSAPCCKIKIEFKQRYARMLVVCICDVFNAIMLVHKSTFHTKTCQWNAENVTKLFGNRSETVQRENWLNCISTSEKSSAKNKKECGNH